MESLNKAALSTEEENPNESGQAVVEYIIILAIAVAVALPLSKQLLELLDNSVARVGATLEKKLYTGRAGYKGGNAVGIWQN